MSSALPSRSPTVAFIWHSARRTLCPSPFVYGPVRRLRRARATKLVGICRASCGGRVLGHPSSMASPHPVELGLVGAGARRIGARGDRLSRRTPAYLAHTGGAGER